MSLRMTDRTALQATPADELKLSPNWQRGPERLRLRAHHSRRLAGDPARLPPRPARARRLGDRAAALSRGSCAYRDLRRFAAVLSERRLARTTVARKLAAVRGFHGHLVTTGIADANPADLLPPTKRSSRLPRVLARDEVAGLLDRIPARTPLEVRDRALFELAYSCGLRAEEIVSLDLDGIDFESELARVTGKGQKTRLVPIGEPAQKALRRYLDVGAPCAWAAARGAGALREPPRPPAQRLRRAPAPEQVGARGRRRGADLAAYTATLVCDASARRRGGPAFDPGAARPLQRVDDADLHAGRAVSPAPGVRKVPSTCMSMGWVSNLRVAFHGRVQE